MNFFLIPCRLRLGLFEQDLAQRFQITQSSVSRISSTWINFYYCKFKELPIWPSRDVVDINMPLVFKNLYPSTRCIIDVMEIFIQKPQNPSAQQLTFCGYLGGYGVVVAARHRHHKQQQPAVHHHPSHHHQQPAVHHHQPAVRHLSHHHHHQQQQPFHPLYHPSHHHHHRTVTRIRCKDIEEN